MTIQINCFLEVFRVFKAAYLIVFCFFFFFKYWCISSPFRCWFYSRNNRSYKIWNGAAYIVLWNSIPEAYAEKKCARNWMIYSIVRSKNREFDRRIIFSVFWVKVNRLIVLPTISNISTLHVWHNCSTCTIMY